MDPVCNAAPRLSTDVLVEVSDATANPTDGIRTRTTAAPSKIQRPFIAHSFLEPS
jgi:hypothetical protein